MPGVLFANQETGELQFYKGGVFGFGEGFCEVVHAAVTDHYYGQNSDNPACALTLTLQRLNDDGSRTNDEPAIEHWDAGPLGRFTPGLATDIDSVSSCEDLGPGKGTEGNCFYSANGELIGGKASQFFERLVKLGFKVQVLGKAYMPSLVGMKMKLQKEPNPFAKKAKDPTILLPVEIPVFPWDTKTASASASAGKAAKPAARPASAKATKPAAAVAAPAATAPAVASAAPSNSGDTSETIVSWLAQHARDNVGTSKTVGKLATAALTGLIRVSKPAAEAAKTAINNPEELAGMVEAVNEILLAEDPAVVMVAVSEDGATVEFQAL